jgi:hypothetical protein
MSVILTDEEAARVVQVMFWGLDLQALEYGRVDRSDVLLLKKLANLTKDTEISRTVLDYFNNPKNFIESRME